MRTKEQVESCFREELQALLDRYNAELEAKDHWTGYSECGQDIRMTVSIPAIYNGNHDCVSEWTEIDLGSWLCPSNNRV